MKKFLIILLSLLTTLVLVTYLLLFTPFGNNILRPYIESEANAYSPLPLSIKTFTLTPSQLDLLIQTDEQNSFILKGELSLFSQTFNLDYTLLLNDLSHFSQLAKRPLKGQFTTEGKLAGNLNDFSVKGTSDFAKSDTHYAVLIKSLSLDKAAIKLQDIHIEKLLEVLNEKAYAKGKVDLHLQLTDFSENHQQGSLALGIKKAKFNPQILSDEFGLKLQKTSIKGEAKVKLDGGKLTFVTDLDSELANINLKGHANSTDEAIDMQYIIDIKELALFKSVTNSELRGPLFTQGSIKGANDDYLLKGDSDLAHSKTTYSCKLVDKSPSALLVSIKDASLAQLLYTLGQEKFASGSINANIQLPDLNPNALKGTIDLTLSQGKIEQKVMKKAFKVTLPKTHFTLDTQAKLAGNQLQYNTKLNSNLANITSEGSLLPETLQTDLHYRIDIKELALFKPITQTDLRGPFFTQGNVKGDSSNMAVNGTSNIADSKTSYHLSLKDNAPEQVKLHIKEARLAKLLYMGVQPDYAQGNINLDLELNAFSPMKGAYTLIVNKGLVHKATVKKAFELTLPYTRFDVESQGTFRDDKLVAKSKINSNLATITMEKSDYDMETSHLNSDFTLKIDDLQKLKPLLERKLIGKISLNGDIKKSTSLTINAHSNLFGGKIDATILDDDVNANFSNLQAQEILKMLDYPQVMNAPLNGTLTYNTLKQKGKLKATFEQAVLVRSKMTDLVSALTHTDLSKERFNKGHLISLINKEIINSDLKMESERVKLQSKKFIINSKKQLIDSRFNLVIKKYPADVIVTGKIQSPNVKLDAKSMITPEVEEKAKKEINRFLKKLF